MLYKSPPPNSLAHLFRLMFSSRLSPSSAHQPLCHPPYLTSPLTKTHSSRSTHHNMSISTLHHIIVPHCIANLTRTYLVFKTHTTVTVLIYRLCIDTLHHCVLPIYLLVFPPAHIELVTRERYGTPLVYSYLNSLYFSVYNDLCCYTLCSLVRCITPHPALLSTQPK
jgi:hypothetical protein